MAGMKIMELYKKDLKPRDIATPAAFKNAMAVDMALGEAMKSIFELPRQYTELGVALKALVGQDFQKYGLELVDLISQEMKENPLRIPSRTDSLVFCGRNVTRIIYSPAITAKNDKPFRKNTCLAKRGHCNTSNQRTDHARQMRPHEHNRVL
jgi:hypothetical protein